MTKLAKWTKIRQKWTKIENRTKLNIGQKWTNQKSAKKYQND